MLLLSRAGPCKAGEAGGNIASECYLQNIATDIPPISWSPPSHYLRLTYTISPPNKNMIRLGGVCPVHTNVLPLVLVLPC